jgi:L-aspartate oxidase
MKKYDVVIMGAGIAGLYTAINLDPKLKVLLLSKKDFTTSNTALAQGGIAVEFDDIESHIQDSLKAGGYANNRESLRIMVENGAKDYEALVRLGVEFDSTLGLEGGHSKRRIAHCKDSTGLEIVTALLKKVKSLKNIDRAENFCAEISISLCHEQYAQAGCVVIATGGIGQVYRHTTNCEIATGDGIYSAYKLGAKIEKMDLIQFHPTAFNGGKLLISEAVRGEGAVLLNKDMQRFTDELAPRDVVSRAVLKEQKRVCSSEFYLDISFREPGFVKSRFPMLYRRLLENGYDLTKQPIPVYPCQHYLMGGIAVDCTGKTNIDGLYAVGECACTGVHGNNRLASNSLLEALVFSRLAAEHINSKSPLHFAPPLQDGKFVEYSTNICEIRDIMQKAFFVIPDYEYAKKGLKRVREMDGSHATVAQLILSEVINNAP